MPINIRQFERDLEAVEMSTPENFNPLRVAIDTQLALERYRINEEARAKAEVDENLSAAFISGSAFGTCVCIAIYVASIYCF